MALPELAPFPLRSQGQAGFSSAFELWAGSFENWDIAFRELASTMNEAVSSTSTTSNSISIASKTFTVEAGKGFAVGMPLRIANSATNYMDGLVTSYSGTSLVVNVTNIVGTGTFTSWAIYAIPVSLGATLGANKFTGAQDFANAVTVASASTVNLNAMASNTGTLTGSTTITAWTLSNGAIRRLLCPAGIQLTYNATTNNLNTGGANYTTQAGDILDITAYGSVIEVVIITANGGLVGGLVSGANNPTFNSTSDTQPTTPAWVAGRFAFYQSTNLTITAGSTTTVSHGLGQKPKQTFAYLICLTAEGGIGVGEEIPMNFTSSAGGNYGLQVSSDASNLYVTVGASGVYLFNKTNGVAFVATPSSWRIILRAFR